MSRSLQGLKDRLRKLDEETPSCTGKSDSTSDHTSTLELTGDRTSLISKIKQSGNKPDDWLNFMTFLENSNQFTNSRTRHWYISNLYADAMKGINDTDKKTLAYAKLLIHCAIFRRERCVEDAREVLEDGRYDAKMFAIVHVAAAELEYGQGKEDKAKKMLDKAKSYGAKPATILEKACSNLVHNMPQLLSDQDARELIDENKENTGMSEIIAETMELLRRLNTRGEKDCSKPRSSTQLESKQGFVQRGSTQPGGKEGFIQRGSTQPDSKEGFVQRGSTQPDGKEGFIQRGSTQPDGKESFLQRGSAQPDGKEGFVQRGITQPDGKEGFVQRGSTQPDGKEGFVQCGTQPDGKEGFVQRGSTQLDGKECFIQHGTQIDNKKAVIQSGINQTDSNKAITTQVDSKDTLIQHDSTQASGREPVCELSNRHITVRHHHSNNSEQQRRRQGSLSSQASEQHTGDCADLSSLRKRLSRMSETSSSKTPLQWQANNRASLDYTGNHTSDLGLIENSCYEDSGRFKQQLPSASKSMGRKYHSTPDLKNPHELSGPAGSTTRRAFPSEKRIRYCGPMRVPKTKKSLQKELDCESNEDSLRLKPLAECSPNPGRHGDSSPDTISSLSSFRKSCSSRSSDSGSVSHSTSQSDHVNSTAELDEAFAINQPAKVSGQGAIADQNSAGRNEVNSDNGKLSEAKLTFSSQNQSSIEGFQMSAETLVNNAVHGTDGSSATLQPQGDVAGVTQSKGNPVKQSFVAAQRIEQQAAITAGQKIEQKPGQESVQRMEQQTSETAVSAEKRLKPQVSLATRVDGQRLEQQASEAVGQRVEQQASQAEAVGQRMKIVTNPAEAATAARQRVEPQAEANMKQRDPSMPLNVVPIQPRAVATSLSEEGRVACTPQGLPYPAQPHPNYATLGQHSVFPPQYPQSYQPMMTPMQNPKKTLVIKGKCYTVTKCIGKGGYSKVYEVLDQDYNMRAVKCVDMDMADDSTIESYRNEIELLRRLQYSKLIIKMFDFEFNEADNKLYVVMEKGERDLASFFHSRRKEKSVSKRFVYYYWEEMLRAVQVLHKEGIVHSDLKPPNFLVVSGDLKLIDFGIARAIQADRTSITISEQVGTLNYMSPEAYLDICGGEQLNDRGQVKPRIKIGVKSDVWSLGCILYFLVYGKTPFQHIKNSLQKLNAISDSRVQIEFPPIESLGGEQNNQHLLGIIKSCLQRDPKQRPSIEELLTQVSLMATS